MRIDIGTDLTTSKSENTTLLRALPVKKLKGLENGISVHNNATKRVSTRVGTQKSDPFPTDFFRLERVTFLCQYSELTRVRAWSESLWTCLYAFGLPTGNMKKTRYPRRYPRRCNRRYVMKETMFVIITLALFLSVVIYLRFLEGFNP